jgi:hypothetical protein
MSEDVRKLDYRQRVPLIIKGVIDGKSYGEIAQECGVTERTIYRDRQSIPFRDFFNPLLDDYMGDLKRLDGAGVVEKRMAVSHRGQLVRAMLKAIIPTKIEAEVKTSSPMRVVFHESLKALPPEEDEEDELP